MFENNEFGIKKLCVICPLYIDALLLQYISNKNKMPKLVSLLPCRHLHNLCAIAKIRYISL